MSMPRDSAAEMEAGDVAMYWRRPGRTGNGDEKESDEADEGARRAAHWNTGTAEHELYIIFLSFPAAASVDVQQRYYFQGLGVRSQELRRRACAFIPLLS
jgi:deferrochelatase/peroxidase EfeB